MQHSFARSIDAVEDRQTNRLDVFISYRRSTGSQLARYSKAITVLLFCFILHIRNVK